MHRISLRLVLALTAAAAVGCQHADSLQLQLLWMPTDNPRDFSPDALNAFQGKTVAVTVADTRSNGGTKVGENHEESKPRPVTTADNIPAFVGKSLTTVLQSNGINVVTGGASRMLNFELAELYVTEDNTYQGNVTLQVAVQNGAGQVLWKGASRGSSHRFGRSFSEENYENVISDATLDALRALLSNPDFQTALRSNS